jgi:hypothetical protein
MIDELRPAAPSLHAAHAERQAALTASAAAGRTVVALGVSADEVAPAVREAAAALHTGPVELGEELRRLDAASAMVLWPDADAAEAAGPVLALVAELAGAGAVVVAGPAGDAGTATRLADRLPGALVLEQRSVEAALLAAPGVDRAPVLPSTAGAPAGWLICCGIDADLIERTCALAAPVASDVREVHLQALEAANAELRRANVRLAREHLGRSDSAAATVVHRLEDALRQRDEADRRFAELRRRLNQPHHRTLDLLVMGLKELPLVGRLTRALTRRYGGS